MKWLLIALCGLSAALVVAGSLALIYQDETKPYIDFYANYAGVFGFLVSVVGFILTIAAVFETLKVSTEAQRKIQNALTDARNETRDLLCKIRIKTMEDMCDQAYLFAIDCRHAIRTGSWLRAAEKCHDARQLASRLLNFEDLLEIERAAILVVVADLKTTIGFIERNRLKEGAPSGLPDDKLQPIDSLIDEIDKVRSRLQQEFLEASNVN